MKRLFGLLGRPFTSLRNRLTLLIFVVTLLAIGTLYVDVAPGLHTRLIQSRYNDLSADARRYKHSIVAAGDNHEKVVDRVDRAAVFSSARVALLSVERTGHKLSLRPIVDSASPRSAPQ